MLNLKTNNFKNIYYHLIIFFFPISILIGNAAININIAIILISGIYVIFQKKIYAYFSQKWFLFALIFWFVILISSFFSYYQIHSLTYTITFLRFILFSLCIQVIFVEKKLSGINFIKYLILLLFVVAIDTIIQKFFGKNIFLFEIIGDGFNSRLTSFFKDEAVVGSYISKFIFIPIFYLFFTESAKKVFKVKKNFLFYLILMISLLAIFFTGERMASLHFLLGLFILFFFMLIRKKLSLKLLVFSLIILTSIFVFDKNIRERFLHSFDKRYGIGNGIINSPWGSHLKAASNMFKENAIIGTGPKTFRIYSCEKDYNKGDKRACSTHPHNILAEILSETGVFGFIFLILFIFVFFKQNKLEDKFFGFTVSLLILLWPLGTSGSFFSTFNGSFIWYILGLLSAFKKIRYNN